MTFFINLYISSRGFADNFVLRSKMKALITEYIPRLDALLCDPAIFGLIY